MNFVAFKSSKFPAINDFASEINSEAKIAGIAPCLLAAIVQRETGGRNVFQDGMPHGPGCGVGLCQITASVDWTNPADPTFAGYALLKPADNLYVAAAYFLAPLVADAARLQLTNPNGYAASCKGQEVYAVAAGYNAGWGAVLGAVAAGHDADTVTTNGYAADVLAKYESFVAESTS